MPKRANWDIVSSVGVTALAAASARAAEALRDPPLVTDPYAAAFVRAANPYMPRPLALTPEELAEMGESFLHLGHYVGIRSRFIDDYCANAAAGGIRQVVILAAGLDARAYRLAWPAGTVVYEVDTGPVLEFKESTLSEAGVPPGCERRAVGADLREDWSAGLKGVGFDPAVPSAWLMEGLLMYLADGEVETLLARVLQLSAPGSRIVAEDMRIGADGVRDPGAFKGAAQWVDTDITDTWSADKRHDPADWLSSRGWRVSAARAGDLASEYGHPMDRSYSDVIRETVLMTASRDAD